MICAEPCKHRRLFRRNAAEHHSARTFNEGRGSPAAVERECEVSVSDRAHQIHRKHIACLCLTHGDQSRRARAEEENDHSAGLARCDRDIGVPVPGLTMSPRILQMVQPKAQRRKAVVLIVRDVKETQLLRSRAEAGEETKTDFAKKPPLSTMLVKAQGQPSAQILRSGLLRIEADADRQGSAARHEMPVRHIERATQTVQHDIHLLLRILQSEINLLRKDRRSEE